MEIGFLFSLKNSVSLSLKNSISKMFCSGRYKARLDFVRKHRLLGILGSAN
ncbi:hypothetical protein SAMN05444483_101479 [Salegentibacter echinorum]|uniref:Uncharacterized protein n=1 Tax=Salegentibacter echinorum TaxID=1073325 RepID=A0A1M5CE21_SALEC|nr:hypothetical protein SAMN05444483_101479 [Salegentibacter echinorum]